MNRFFITAQLLLFSINIFGQSLDWLWTKDLPSNSEQNHIRHIPKSIFTDHSMNIYVHGNFDFDIQIGDTVLTNEYGHLFSHPLQFLAEYKPNGDFKRAIDITIPFVDFGVNVDQDGHFHLFGFAVNDTLAFPDTTIIKEDLFGRIFHIEYNRDWEFISFNDQVSLSGSGYMVPEAISLVSDSQNNVYGLMKARTEFVEIGDSILTADIQQEHYYLLLKYGSDGKVEWLKKFDMVFFPGNFDVSLALDYEDNLIFAGTYWGYLKEGGIQLGSLVQEGQFRDCFVFKYAPDGTRIWVKSFGGFYSEDYCNNIAIDRHNNIYLTGTFEEGVIEFDDLQHSISINDPYFLRLTPEGVFDLIKIEPTNNAFSAGRAIAVDNGGNIYMAGQYSRDNSLIGDSLIQSTPFADRTEVFVAKYDYDGNFLELITAEGACNDGVTDMTSDPNGNIVLTGYYECDLEIGNNIFSTMKDYSFGYNIYVSKLSTETPLDVMEGINRDNMIRLFPNPSNGEIKVEMPAFSSIGESLPYHIFDANGRLVQKGTVGTNTTLNTSTLSEGIYFFKILGQYKKLIIY